MSECTNIDLENARKRVPVIAIFRISKERFEVQVDGKTIPSLRSFSVTIVNKNVFTEVSEAPFYQIEQYMTKDNSTE